MKALVTGAGGFIGSHLCERLIDEGINVIGVDSFTPYYDPRLKRENFSQIADKGVETIEADLMSVELDPLLEDVDVVFHQAGEPGVRASWEQLEDYQRQNISATYSLLDAAKRTNLARFVYASSSSIYGTASTHPTSELELPQPVSPYGMTKLAGEHLCRMFAENFDVPTVSLRYFTVFGPRQRPDMAFRRLITAALSGQAFPLYGDGKQVRDFTYVDDVIEANFRAATQPDVPPGLVVNIAGGGAWSLSEVIAEVERLSGTKVELERSGPQHGDVRRTSGATDVAWSKLKWKPKVSVTDGLERQFSWQSELLRRTKLS